MEDITRIEYNGSIIEGEFVSPYEGKGTITFPDGRKYVGEWKYYKPHGHGILYNAEGKKRIEGNFVDGILDGYGTFYLSEGKRYVGEIGVYDDIYKPKGQGTVYRSDGTKLNEGHYERGELYGPAKLYDEKGNFFFEGEVYLENGKLLDKSHGIQYSNGRHKMRVVNGEWVEVGGSSGSSGSSGRSGSSGGSGSSGKSGNSGSSSDDGCGCGSCLGSIVAILIIWWLLGWMGFVGKPNFKFFKKQKTEQVEQVEEKQEAPAKKKSASKRKKARQAKPAEEQPAEEEVKGGFHLEPVEGNAADAPATEEAPEASSGKSFHLEPVEEVPSVSPSTPEETPAE